MTIPIANNDGSPLAPVHPGEILEEEFLKPLNLTAYRVAALVDVPRTRIERLVGGKTPVTPDTAQRLGRLFETSAQFWMNLQASYDLHTTPAETRAAIERIQPYPELHAEHA